jgi:hypothetical protein
MRQPHDRRRALAFGWSVTSAVPLLAIALGILTQPDFPLGLGIIRTRGLMGLWATLFPAIIGVSGVVLFHWSNRAGSGLILAYSAFWSLLLASILPTVWNAESSFCLQGLGVCITAPWLARLTVLGLLTPFFLLWVWSWHTLWCAMQGER